jgi:hypothetical protein
VDSYYAGDLDREDRSQVMCLLLAVVL